MAVLHLRQVGQVCLLFLQFCISFVYAAPTESWYGGAVYVAAGESIQAAITAAPPGQLIIVKAGTYAEQLTITTDGIRLVGQGAILVPPATNISNTCSGLAGPDTEAGICIEGQGIQLADFVVEHRKVLAVGTYVKDVLVTGFQVQGFSGLNIAVVGGQGCQVIGNTLYDGAQYGSLTVGSKDTLIDANVVTPVNLQFPFIAICMDDMSDVRVTNNRVDSYSVGLCVQTNGAYVAHNDVAHACFGVYVDPGVTGAMILDNNIHDGLTACATIPDVGLFGIIMSGAQDTQVKGNLVTGMLGGGASNATAVGIAIIDDPSGVIANGNVVTANVLKNNDHDIAVVSNGTGNVAERNQCANPACG